MPQSRPKCVPPASTLSLGSTGGGGIPWRLAKRMTEGLAKFAMAVSKGPRSCSAVKLKCISPIPISTTPDATIVQMIRDRIRFSSAAGYKPRCAELFSATQRPKREYERHKEGAGSEVASDV